MEKRIKSVGSYEKSGKLFLNEFSRIQKKDSFERNEYYLDFYSNGKIKNWYIQPGIFNEYTSLVFDQIKINEYPYGNEINHTLKIPVALRYLVDGTYLDNRSGISELSRPSYYNSNNFQLNYNSSYNNLSINELNKYNQIILDTQIKKPFNNRWTINNLDESFNDSDQSYLNIQKERYLTLGLNSILLNEQFNFKFESTLENILDNQNNKILGNSNYSLLDSNQKSEKTIEINLDIPNDLILQYMAKTLEDDIVRNYNYNTPNLNDDDQDTDDSVIFRYLNINDPIIRNLMNPIRFKSDKKLRKINRLNTPFAMYNFSKKNWENRGLIYPLKHLTTYYINFFNLNTQITPIDNNPDLNYVTYLNKINFTNNDITNFLNYFKKYHITHDTLTTTSTSMIKVFGKSNEVISGNIEGKYNNYSYPIMSIPTEQFGFPNHFKFHCFEDNLIEMSNFIEKPFVLNRTNFSTKVEVIGEFTTEDAQYYEDPFNICLNYFIIKQTELPKVNEDINTNWKPFFNKQKTKSYQFTNENNSNFILNNFDVNLDDANSEYQSLSNCVIRKLSNDIDHKYTSGFLTDSSFYINENLNDGVNNKIDHNKKYLREIINYGNMLFLTPSIVENDNIPISNKIEKLKKLIINNNFDEIKIIEYPSHSNILITNNLVGILDYSGQININSSIKIPSQITNNINAHLLNLNFDMPIGNKFNKFSGTRSLNEFISPNQKIKNYNYLDLPNEKDIEFFNDAIFRPTDILNPPQNDVNINSDIQDDYFLYQYNNSISNDSISKYVLYPNDKIAICVSISPSIHPLKLKQLIKIKKGKCKISLFGYHENETKRIYDENRLLKNYKSNNFPTVIIGDILNTNEYSTLKELNYLNYLDKQITKNLSFFEERRVNINNSSSIQEGKTFNPYLRIGNDYRLNVNEKCIYDDCLLQFPKKSSYKVVSGKYYFTENIFNKILKYKNYQYHNQFTFYTENLKNINLQSDPIYFSSKRYGQFRDIIEQRKYTTMYNINERQKESVVYKEYIDPDNCQIISDLTDVYGLNKSLTYELVDSKGTPVTTNENNIGPIIDSHQIENLPFPFYDNISRWNINWTWSYDDILNLKHVAFRENVSS